MQPQGNLECPLLHYERGKKQTKFKKKPMTDIVIAQKRITAKVWLITNTSFMA